MRELISRQAAIDTVRKAKDKSELHRMLVQLPSAQLAQDLTKGCTDTISRAAVVDVIEGVDWYHQNKNGEMVHGANDDVHQAWYKAEDIYKAIKSVPSAQSERPKGEWIYGEHDIAMCDGYWCDQCGFFVPWDYKHKFIDFIKDYHWCPSCGADMRGEQDG